jgi:hypothetical protein
MVALDVLDESEGAGAEDMRHREERILLELRRAIDAVPRRGEIGEHRRFRPFEMEYDGTRVRRVDGIDRRVAHLARRDDALGRVRDALVARLDVHRTELRAVMEQDVRAQPEGVGELVGRDAPALGEVAFHLRIVCPVEFEQRRVVRRYRMEESEGDVGVAVIARRLGIDGEFKHAATLGRGALRGRLRRQNGECEACGSQSQSALHTRQARARAMTKRHGLSPQSVGWIDVRYAFSPRRAVSGCLASA